MLGAIVGDIVGSVYELDNHKNKDFQLFREDSKFTDDTILTIATADGDGHSVGRTGIPRDRIRRDIEAQFEYDLSTSVDELRETYQYNETCQQTVSKALWRNWIRHWLKVSYWLGIPSYSAGSVFGLVRDSK